jgi:hypothetical protein
MLAVTAREPRDGARQQQLGQAEPYAEPAEPPGEAFGADLLKHRAFELLRGSLRRSLQR